MPPFIETAWGSHEIPLRAQVTEKGSKRKGFNGDLKGCEILELLQYSCFVEEPASRHSVTKCMPIERLFRRCKDGKRTFMIETTGWKETAK